MMVLVDTPIWSLALRRTVTDLSPREQSLTAALRELIQDRLARIIGPVRQELLSGIRLESVFRQVRDRLRAFEGPTLKSPTTRKPHARITDAGPKASPGRLSTFLSAPLPLAVIGSFHH